MPLILFVTFCLRVFASQDSADRNAGWRSDLQFLLTEARRLHASPARPAYSPQFQEAITRLADRVPRLNDAAMVVQVQWLMALDRSCHTGGPVVCRLLRQ